IVSVIGEGTLERLNAFLVTGTQTPLPTPLTLSPDVGLIAFVVGAGALVFACYRRLEELIASQALVFAQSEEAARPPESCVGENAEQRAEAVAPAAPDQATRPAGGDRAAPVTRLPGTPGWTEAPQVPDIMRNGAPIRGLRRFDRRSSV